MAKPQPTPLSDIQTRNYTQAFDAFIEERSLMESWANTLRDPNDTARAAKRYWEGLAKFLARMAKLTAVNRVDGNTIRSTLHWAADVTVAGATGRGARAATGRDAPRYTRNAFSNVKKGHSRGY